MSGARPTLGVVVPTLDEALALPALLERLLGAHQAHEHGDRADHVVVADGGSGDATVAVAEAGGAEVVPAPRGRGSQLAAGAERLETDLIWLLHADCVPEPHCLRALREAFAADAGLLAAGCAQRIAGEGRFYRWVERAADRRVRRGMVYGDSALCLRAELYRAVGGVAALPLFEDVELCERLAAHDGGRARPRLVPEARVTISPRRWQREGRVRATVRNWTLRACYAAGVAPERLAGWYRPHGH